MKGKSNYLLVYTKVFTYGIGRVGEMVCSKSDRKKMIIITVFELRARVYFGHSRTTDFEKKETPNCPQYP